MAIARLVLDYLQALIWPALVVGLLIRFGPYIWSLVQRVSSGGQLQVGGPGFQVLLDFRDTVRQIAAESPDPELRESARLAEERLDRELLAVTSSFYAAPLGERQRLAEEMKRRTARLSLGELLALAESDDPAERVAAGIGLGERLRASSDLRQDQRVVGALRSLINDREHSRVRYRAAEALRKTPQLVSSFESELIRLAEHDSNDEVRGMAARALRGRLPSRTQK